MAGATAQRAAFAFFADHLQSQELFTLEELSDVTGWNPTGTTKTYLGKQFRGFVEDVGKGQYRVTDAFWRFSEWTRFRELVTQVRRAVTSYEPQASSQVLIYDFLMPLANEEYLRLTLDALFFKDRLMARIEAVGLTTFERAFARGGEGDSEYVATILRFVEDRFVGYSVSHVDGRFRGSRLMTHEEAATLAKQGRRYLIDETTAIVRFIFPYEDDEALAKTKLLFEILFVRSVIQLVSGEDQIWMVQSGSDGSSLHVWERLNDANEDDLD